MDNVSKTNTESIPSVIEAITLKGPTDPVEKTDDGVFGKIKKYFTDIVETMRNKDNAFNIFQNNFMFLKTFGLALLIVMAIVNYYRFRNAGLISSKPFTFGVESFIFGLCVSIPFLFVAMFRNEKYDQKELVVIAVALLIVCIIVNYLMELSGFYAYMFEPKDKEPDPDCPEKNYKQKFWKNISITCEFTTIAIIIGSILGLIVAAMFIRDTNMPSLSIFLVETFVVGLVSAFPLILIAYNRGSVSYETYIECVVLFVKFCLLHIVLQYAGFYSFIFKKNHKF